MGGAAKAYATLWKEVDALDLACKKKELALAQKEYGDVLGPSPPTLRSSKRLVVELQWPRSVFGCEAPVVSGRCCLARQRPERAYTRGSRTRGFEARHRACF